MFHSSDTTPPTLTTGKESLETTVVTFEHTQVEVDMHKHTLSDTASNRHTSTFFLTLLSEGNDDNSAMMIKYECGE